jgi:hypothetical protein
VKFFRNIFQKMGLKWGLSFKRYLYRGAYRVLPPMGQAHVKRIARGGGA